MRAQPGLTYLAIRAVSVMASGCGFANTPDMSLVAPDAPPAADAPGTIDAPAIAPFCDPADLDLVACYELEGTTEDGSGHQLHATMTNVTFVPGRAGMAAHLVDGSALDVTEAVALDVPAITIEAWIRADALPAPGLRAGIVDNNGQYGFFLQPEGALQGLGITAAAAVPIGSWTHVAITYDGTTRIYRDGLEVSASGGGGGALGSGGTTGTSIGADNPPGAGSPLLGDLDQLRIYRVARTAAQICADAAGTGCPPAS